MLDNDLLVGSDNKPNADLLTNINLDNDCWLSILEYISDARTLLAVSRTCKQLYYIYKTNESRLLYRCIEITEYGNECVCYTAMFDCHLLHGMFDESDYSSSSIKVNIKYFNTGRQSDKYPVSNAKQIHCYKGTEHICKVFNIVNSKIDGEYIRMAVSVDGDIYTYMYYNIIYFDQGICKYYMIYNISRYMLYINDGLRTYHFDVLYRDTHNDVRIEDNNKFVSMLETINKNLIYNIKVYNTRINIRYSYDN